MKEYKFSEICRVINGRAYKQEELLQNGTYKVLRVGNFFSSDRWYYSDLELDEDKYCNNGDLLFAWSASFGPKIWRGDKTIYHYHIWKLVENSSYADRNYIYYWLLNSVNKLTAGVHGSVMAHMTKKEMEDQKINLPDLSIQKKVGAILALIDEKIRKNEAINRNLLEQSKTLYKSWFMDFDNTDGVMPQDWHEGTVEEIIELHDSIRKPLSGNEREKLDKIYPYYGATSIMDYVDDYLFDGIYLLLGEDGSVIDADGYPILQYVFGKFWANNHAHIITGKNGFSVEELYLLFSLTHVNDIVTGAVQLKISQQNLKKVEAVIPSKNALRDFDEIIQPMFGQIRKIRLENEKLTSLRDSLLPKLMSGELEVSDIDI